MKEFKISKLILTEKDLIEYGILDDYSVLRSKLYRANDRIDCFLIQGGAFVIKGKAFLVMGVAGIDYLDSLSQSADVEGIIGNGNVLFISKDFKRVYSAHDKDELQKCYELEGSNIKAEFLTDVEIGHLIFLVRSFYNVDEYNDTKEKANNIIFESEELKTFAKEPIRFGGSLKARLRWKFIKTARIVHCARRPNLMQKECIFDSIENISKAIDNFDGSFLLVYTLWSQELCDVSGMKNTRKLSDTYNPTDPITLYFVDMAKRYL